MKPGWQIALPWEGIQEGLCKLHQPVHIGEVGDQAERNTYGATALHAQIPKKLIPTHPPFSLEELRERVPGLLVGDVPQRLFREMEGRFASTRITKTACTQGEADLAGSVVHYAFVNHRPMRVEEIERDCPTAPVSGVRAIDLHQWRPIAMAQGQQCVEQPARQTLYPFVDRFHSDGQEVFQTNFDSRQSEIVERPVFIPLSS